MVLRACCCDFGIVNTLEDFGFMLAKMDLLSLALLCTHAVLNDFRDYLDMKFLASATLLTPLIRIEPLPPLISNLGTEIIWSTPESKGIFFRRHSVFDYDCTSLEVKL
jgi:hypothetical protein